MILCPVCGSAKSYRSAGGARECSDCGRVYELPKPRPTRQRRKPREQAPAVVDEPVEEKATDVEDSNV